MPAFFDVKKLRAFNGAHIRALPVAEFIDACQPWLRGNNTSWPAAAYDETAFATVAELVQTRISVLSEVVPMVDFLFVDPPLTDHVDDRVLASAIDAYETTEWRVADLKAALETIATAHGHKLGKAQAPVRLAVTGRTVGLPLFESLEVLGRERTLARLTVALNRIG